MTRIIDLSGHDLLIKNIFEIKKLDRNELKYRSNLMFNELSSLNEVEIIKLQTL